MKTVDPAHRLGLPSSCLIEEHSMQWLTGDAGRVAANNQENLPLPELLRRIEGRLAELRQHQAELGGRLAALEGEFFLLKGRYNQRQS